MSNALPPRLHGYTTQMGALEQRVTVDPIVVRQGTQGVRIDFGEELVEGKLPPKDGWGWWPLALAAVVGVGLYAITKEERRSGGVPLG